MSEKYKKLLDEWRGAADKTRAAQQKLKDQFELFLQGRGPEPSKAQTDRVQALRDIESAKLEAAMAYVRRTARRE
jgi:hypothetical protein